MPTAERASLFSLTGEWLALLSALEEAAGEMTPEIQAEWDRLTAAFENKVDGYGYVLRTLEAGVAAHRERAEYHQKAAQVRTNMVKRLKQTLTTVLQALGTRKLEGQDFTAFLKVSKHVEVTDQYLLPKEYLRVTVEPDRQAIAKAYGEGKTVPGAVMEENTSAYVR